MGTVTMSLEQYEKLMNKVRLCNEVFVLSRSYTGKYVLAIKEGTAHMVFKRLLAEREDLAEYKLVHDNYDAECARAINEYNMYAECEKEENQEDEQ